MPQDHWANPYVEAMTQKGVVTGVGNGRFNPDGNLSTAEFSVMLTQAFCPKEVADPEEGAAWWEPYLNAAWEAGYLTDTTAGFSYADGSWDADVVTAPMTRYDMAQAMNNTVAAEKMTLPTDEQRERPRPPSEILTPSPRTMRAPWWPCTPWATCPASTPTGTSAARAP